MSKYLSFLSLCLFFSCQEKSTPSQDDLLSQMSDINDQIETLIVTTCSTTSQCMATAFGAKPCGGPYKYLVHSSQVDLVKLYTLVGQYNSLNQQYNEETGIGSDCAFVTAPEVECVSGNCQSVVN